MDVIREKLKIGVRGWEALEENSVVFTCCYYQRGSGPWFRCRRRVVHYQTQTQTRY